MSTFEAPVKNYQWYKNSKEDIYTPPKGKGASLLNKLAFGRCEALSYRYYKSGYNNSKFYGAFRCKRDATCQHTVFGISLC